MKHVKFRFGKVFNVEIGNTRSQAALTVLKPGESEGGKGNHHRGADQWLYVVSSRGLAIVQGKRVTLSSEALVLIERGENHEIRNTGTTDLRTVNIYVPPAYEKMGQLSQQASREAASHWRRYCRSANALFGSRGESVTPGDRWGREFWLENRPCRSPRQLRVCQVTHPEPHSCKKD
jgi:mannose-6-phosphate isomerase-like protein (cupin superfamily)